MSVWETNRSVDSTGRVWRVHLSALNTPLRALVLLGLVLGGGEIAARSAFVHSRLAAPSVGSPSRHLDQQLAKLNVLVEREGGIDCIFLGNSMVLFGLDPEAFDAAYEARTGRRLRSFNFGVGGITVSSTAAIARILAEDYHPWLIIYGLTARDFSTTADAPSIEAIPWVRYRQGDPNLNGWLADHSHLYRYFLHYGWQTQPAIHRGARDFAAGTPRGFYPIEAATVFDAAAFVRAKGLLSARLGRGVSAQQRIALGTLLHLGDSGVQVLIIEMPVHLDPSEWPNDAATSYRQLMEEVRQAARSTATPVWPPMAPRFVPEDGWLDVWHLNSRGASVFGRWLGERVAAAVEAGEFTRPDSAQLRPRP
jgi:hypothetical protein